MTKFISDCPEYDEYFNKTKAMKDRITDSEQEINDIVKINHTLSDALNIKNGKCKKQLPKKLIEKLKFIDINNPFKKK